MSGVREPTETRGERKERTRRAILDAALALCEDTSLAALSLRQVAKEVGIVPTAFYRHFDSIEALGLALVDESFVVPARDAARRTPRRRRAVQRHRRPLGRRPCVEHVHQQRAHFLFIARERAAGPPSVREAIRHEIELSSASSPPTWPGCPAPTAWSAEDLRVLSNLIVTAMVVDRRAACSRRRPARRREADRRDRPHPAPDGAGRRAELAVPSLTCTSGLLRHGYRRRPRLHPPQPNPFQRAMQAFASTRPGAWLVLQGSCGTSTTWSARSARDGPAPRACWPASRCST